MAASATDLGSAPQIGSTPCADHRFGRADQAPRWRSAHSADRRQYACRSRRQL